MSEQIACDECHKFYERGSECRPVIVPVKGGGRVMLLCYVCAARKMAQSNLPGWLPRWFKHLVF